uniref:HdeD family acid-resistance protein n=1 Tax=Thaumasiovibrio occultus TaxID=1891184 RepID=UPI00131D0500|nr:HdeD family acid-resistance protein [Thaumasiovibrio occultus]
MNFVSIIKQNAKRAKWIGIVMFIAGIIAIISPLAAGLSITVVLGLFMLIGGLAQLALVFGAKSASSVIWLLGVAVLYLIVGGVVLAHPVAALETLTLVLAGYFVLSGLFEIFAALQARPSAGWGWIMCTGIISVLLGAMIWNQYPVSGVWALGTLVGIRLITNGMTLFAVGKSVEKAAENEAS